MLRDDIFSHITEKDLQSGAALRDLPNLLKVLDIVRGKGIRRMCDIGCGYGGLTKIVSRYLQVDEVYGIDIDDERLQVASQRGIKVFRVDIEYEKLSFPDEYFDLVTSFGVLEHLKHFDNFFTESYRVLRKGGFLIISMPNLGSWINRIALLLGFQPRDVEVSCRVRNQGFLPIYSGGSVSYTHLTLPTN